MTQKDLSKSASNKVRKYSKYLVCEYFFLVMIVTSVGDGTFAVGENLDQIRITTQKQPEPLS